MEILKSKNFLLGLISGLFIGFLLFSVFLVRKPLLVTEQDKASYSLGQQIGKNFKNQKFEISPTVFSAAMNDAYNSTSRLSPEELVAGKKYLFAQTDLGKKQQNPQDNEQVSAEGFFELSPGFKVKFLSEKKKRIVHLNEIKSQMRPARDYAFKISFENSGSKEMQFSFPHQKLPRHFSKALSFLEENEEMQIQMFDREHQDLTRLLNAPRIKEATLIRVQRLKLKKGSSK